MNFEKVVDRTGTYCTQWDYVEDRFGVKDLLPFTISDMDFEVAKEIKEAVVERALHGVYGYSRWNHDEYKNAIKHWFDVRFDTEIDTEHIAYAPSVMYAVAKVIELKSQVGEGVVIQTPAYDAFYKVIEDNGRKLIENPMIDRGGCYDLDFEGLEQCLKEAKILLLCSPHNPTGKLFSKEELIKIIDLCKKYDVFIISDEIHMDIVFGGRRNIPILKHSGDYSKSVALLSSASKSFNTPSLGGSYLVLPDKELKEKFLFRLKNQDNLSSPDIMGIVATITAYTKCEYWIDNLLEYLQANAIFAKDYIDRELDCFEVKLADSCYFSWINFEATGLSSEELQDKLINKGRVAIMPGHTYGEAAKSYLRFNLGASRRKVEEGLNRIKTAVEGS